MAVSAFPRIESAHESGLLAVGGDLEPGTLLLAYRSGIFPWPIDEEHVLCWFTPPKRAVLYLDSFHLGRSLRKELKRKRSSFAIDRDFDAVIQACSEATNRAGQRGTWILPQICQAYSALHRAGYCHSVECYEDGRLVGGLYGVAIGAVFCGESMFHHVPNASKLALWFLVEHLKKQGAKWLDCQLMTPFLASLGAAEVPRSEFTKMLKEEIDKPLKLFGA
jgi:leucyl/phenylalanyl-tRNA--protein transferase